MPLVDLTDYHVLLVDDVSFSRSTIARQLRTLGNPEILEAENGEEALKYLTRESVVDIVISDFNMPIMNGLELLQHIRSGSAGVRRDLAFAILTGFSDRHLVDMALSLAVNAFLVKPVSRATLSDRLSQIIATADGRMPPKSAEEYSEIALPEGEISSSGFNNSFEQMLKTDAEMFNFLPADTEASIDLTPTAMETAKPANAVSGKDMLSDASEREVKSIANVIRVMTCLRGRYSSDLARAVVLNVKKLIMAAGEERALEIVTDLNDLVEQKALRVDDLPTILSQNRRGGSDSKPNGWNIAHSRSGDGREEQQKLDETTFSNVAFHDLDRTPENAVLGRSLYTTNGNVFLVSGTYLTHNLLSILRDLHKMGGLDLHSGGDRKGVYVAVTESTGNAPAPVPNRLAAERKITIEEADVGMVVLRDVYTNTGINYMNEGTVLTEGLLTVLHDLQQLGSVDNELWVQASK